MRKYITAVVVGATTFIVYLASTVDGPANRIATCPVRISEECQALYPSLRPYETLRFPVARSVTADGGIQILLPRPAQKIGNAVRDCVEVMDWSQCDLNTCAAVPGICEKWSDANPFTRVRSASKHVIPDCRDPDGGWNENHAPVDCLATGPSGARDGGAVWRGCNVFPFKNSTGTACLDAPSGVVWAGERIEQSL